MRQWWGRDPEFTLVMLSLSSLGALFFRGRLVRRVVTGYSGDTFPNFTPNRVFQTAYADGSVEVEHWSFLAFAQRLEAAARGLPAVVTRSIEGSSMEQNDGYTRVDTPFGEVGLLSPMQPDIALLHAPVADRAGNVAIHPPLLEGVWGALAARRGAIVTVERIVDDIRPWSHLVRIPAHRVLAVVETPFGAHPGGLYTGSLPAEGYGEDYEFWVGVRAATRPRRLRRLDSRVGARCRDPGAISRQGRRREPRRAPAPSRTPTLGAPTKPPICPISTRRRTHGSRPRQWRPATSRRTPSRSTPTRYSPAQVWRTSRRGSACSAREGGAHTTLTAEIGMWDYTPVPADPFVLNHRNFPTTAMLSDANTVLGTLVGGYGTTTIGCLGGAQIDRFGNINSTSLLADGGPFLVGSGGGNDVASTASECIVVALLTPQRTPPDCSYVTSPGRVVRTLVTDLATFEKIDGDASGELVLTAVPQGSDTVDEHVARARAATGWDVRVAPEVRELQAVEPDDVACLRRWDPRAGSFAGRAQRSAAALMFWSVVSVAAHSIS